MANSDGNSSSPLRASGWSARTNHRRARAVPRSSFQFCSKQGSGTRTRPWSRFSKAVPHRRMCSPRWRTGQKSWISKLKPTASGIAGASQRPGTGRAPTSRTGSDHSGRGFARGHSCGERRSRGNCRRFRDRHVGAEVARLESSRAFRIHNGDRLASSRVHECSYADGFHC